MKISIITTVYKAEKDLPRLLESMMAQRNPELEFFLIDNGSPDRCGEICREYATRDPRFVVYTLNENIGYIRARNIGIQACNGDYIGFCDSDDYLEPGGYDRAAERIKQTQCDFYAAAWCTVSSSKTENRLPVPAGVYEKDAILPLTFGPVGERNMFHGFVWKNIYRRQMILDAGITFLETLKPYEDQIFNIDVMQKCACICIDDGVLYNYVVNEQSITAQMYQQYDAPAEWLRMTALYQQKNARAQAPLHTEALCNQMLLSLYSLICAMAKNKQCTVSSFKHFFDQRAETALIQEVLDGSSRNQSIRLRFVRWSLKHSCYRLLYIVTTTILKLREG